LIFLDLASVHPSSVTFSLFNWDDSIIEGYRRVADAVHPHGTKLFHQLWHGGALWPAADGGPPWSCSPLAQPFTGVVPIEMTQAMIDEVAGCFAEGARRAEAGGLDGLEVHAGHGYLIQQFLAASTNRRTDGYGGDLDGRFRFLHEVMVAVRAAVSPTFAVGIRISDQLTPGGLGPDECAEVVRRLEAEGLIDFVNASQGSYYSTPSMLPTHGMGIGSMLASSGPIAAAASRIPRIVAGRFQTLRDAADVIASGVADLVGMVRPMLADPDLISKYRRGEVDRVRPCIGCNQGCVGGILGPMHRVGCAVNPAAGMETVLAESLIEKVTTPRRVAVVGGGPAGMEAARVAALRGHQVTLYEAAERTGGALRVAERAPALEAMGQLADWYERELHHLGVTVHTGRTVRSDEVAADAVIVASGSKAGADPSSVAAPGVPAKVLTGARVVDARDLLAGEADHHGSTAVVVDDTGLYEAAAAAEFLLEAGASVTYVTRHSQFAAGLEMIARAEPTWQRLRAHGRIELLTDVHVTEAGPGTCTVRPLRGGQDRVLVADLVVVAGYRLPVNEVGLPSAVETVTVGDARSPRGIQEAIREGHLAGRSV
jgi:2,4-dienoyl-CoA reductase-like NADH-dependent reductase (Old Yellow Enzyme family)/pyruvate/2-oxoglutarate dehydrogenase complex dihydrolipoamide dehydrogenase (E3) component